MTQPAAGNTARTTLYIAYSNTAYGSKGLYQLLLIVETSPGYDRAGCKAATTEDGIVMVVVFSLLSLSLSLCAIVNFFEKNDEGGRFPLLVS